MSDGVRNFLAIVVGGALGLPFVLLLGFVAAFEMDVNIWASLIVTIPLDCWIWTKLCAWGNGPGYKGAAQAKS